VAAGWWRWAEFPQKLLQLWARSTQQKRDRHAHRASKSLKRDVARTVSGEVIALCRSQRLSLESRQALFTRNRPQCHPVAMASSTKPAVRHARRVFVVSLSSGPLRSSQHKPGCRVWRPLGRSSGVPPGRVDWTIGCIPASIDQATKPLGASQFVMASGYRTLHCQEKHQAP
jgi:hypothetical protein